MADHKRIAPGKSRCLPTMTQDYSRISDTAKAITSRALPRIAAYLQSIAPRIADMKKRTPFVMADFGAADGANESVLFEALAEQIHSINPSIIVKIFFIDLANPDCFDRYWKSAKLAQMDCVEAEYIKRSFYEPFPEIIRQLHLGFSSTALHWLDTRASEKDFFQHPEHIQANQLPDGEKGKFAEKWRSDWKVFFRERSAELLPGGALFLANLASFGGENWPASAGYNNLRDICLELHREGRISGEELRAVFMPDYFATPEEMKTLLYDHELMEDYTLSAFSEMTIPCAYFTPVEKKLGNPQVRAELADQLAHVVRAWSESSIKTGLFRDHIRVVDEIYQRLRKKFYETPKGLPYQYCLMALLKLPCAR